MNNATRQKLLSRNEAIIQAVITKMQKHCPDSVDLIGIAGSFGTGEYHEKSDLDLCIITTDDKAQKLKSCFILEDVAHDIYCSSWERLEKMAKYNNPHISKLFEMEIVYEKNISKYNKLREKALANMQDHKENVKKAAGHLNIALQNYARLILSEDLLESLSSIAMIVMYIEYSIYMLNGTYIKKGIKGIPNEILQLPQLPKDFETDYLKVFSSSDIEAFKHTTTKVIKNVKSFVEKQNQETKERKEITSDDLTGTYEELYSNWRNKMYLAIKDNNQYLSFMTMASAQGFYNEMADKHEIAQIKLLDKYEANSLRGTAEAFDEAISKWKQLYERFDKPIKHYQSIEKFVKAYSEA